MIRTFALLCAIAIAAALPASAQDVPAGTGNVPAYHANAARSGNFVMPDLTWERARSVHADGNFRAQVAGSVYAQPLYWRGAGDTGILIVATEQNEVVALDGATGKDIWRRTLGRPVNRGALSCGNIDPLGITGTPVVDEAGGALYLNAAILDGAAPHHRIFGLSLKDGSVLPGWPIDVGEIVRGFNARDQNQRGALAILDGKLYVPYGGHFGDCGDYRGRVVSVSLRDPKQVASWETRARGGGIWAPGGISIAGGSLFVATGNTMGASSWGDGEAVIRLAPDLHRSNDSHDYFAPSDWHTLDARDADLGGSNALPFDVEGPAGAMHFVLALGKDGKAYLLDRDNLGGIGGSLAVETVTQSAIRTAPAVYPVGRDAFVALQARGANCPAQGFFSGSRDLVVLKISAGARPSVPTAWCGSVRGTGAPIVTTTDGRANPIVWIVGAEGDNRLHGFKGDTGEPLTDAGANLTMSGVHHFEGLIAAGGRLYVGADGRIFAFAF
jgi:PQQ-like domain